MAPRSHPILNAVGIAFAQRNAMRLLGLSHGVKRDLGTCIFRQLPVTFDWWFPHLGIAIDEHVPPGGILEVEYKRQWCHTDDRRILYFGPDDLTDMDFLREKATERRNAVQHG